MIWNGAPSSVKIGKKIFYLMPGKDVPSQVENFWKTTESKKHGNLKTSIEKTFAENEKKAKERLAKKENSSSEASTASASVKTVSAEKEKDKASA